MYAKMEKTYIAVTMYQVALIVSVGMRDSGSSPISNDFKVRPKIPRECGRQRYARYARLACCLAPVGNSAPFLRCVVVDDYKGEVYLSPVARFRKVFTADIEDRPASVSNIYCRYRG
jgi:hypothetical protein